MSAFKGNQAKGIGLLPNFLGVDSPFFSTIVLFKDRSLCPWVLDGFLKRSGSLERMELEGTLAASLLSARHQENGVHYLTNGRMYPPWPQGMQDRSALQLGPQHGGFPTKMDYRKMGTLFLASPRHQNFGGFCLDVRTLTFANSWGCPLNH